MCSLITIFFFRRTKNHKDTPVDLQKARKLENLKSSSMVQGTSEITRLPQISWSYKNTPWWVKNYTKDLTSLGMLKNSPVGQKSPRNSSVSHAIQKLQEIPRMFEKPLEWVFHQDHENTTITIRKHYKEASNFLCISFENWTCRQKFLECLISKLMTTELLVHILLGTKHVHLDRAISHHEQKRLRQRREPPRT